MHVADVRIDREIAPRALIQHDDPSEHSVDCVDNTKAVYLCDRLNLHPLERNKTYLSGTLSVYASCSFQQCSATK
jgi:hypothetical protein